VEFDRTIVLRGIRGSRYIDALFNTSVDMVLSARLYDMATVNYSAVVGKHEKW
jgi:hypothetical protein